MALYATSLTSIGQQSLAASPTSSHCDIKAAATLSSSLTEISAFVNRLPASTVLTMALWRSPTELVQLGAQNFISEEEVGSLSETKMATAWTVCPLYAAPFLRLFNHTPSAAGVGVVWSFPRGLRIAPSTSLVFGASSPASTLFQISAEIDE